MRTLMKGCLWVLLLGSLACDRTEPAPVAETQPVSSTPTRIISLAPSITEVLFELGLGDHIIGVTQFCKFPEAAQSKTSIGGYYNPNYEAMVGLKPDLIITLKEHTKERKYFDELSIPWLEVNHHSVASIFASIEAIGKATGRQEQAQKLKSSLESRLNQIGEKTKHLPRPTVLVSVGRNMGTGTIKDAYIAGKEAIFNELIALAGGQNVYTDDGRAYPIVSAEGLLTLNPDIIIDMVPHRKDSQISAEDVHKEWLGLSKLKAVQSNQVHIFDQDYVTIPGPRLFLLLEQMAQAIHPQQFAEPPQDGNL